MNISKQQSNYIKIIAMVTMFIDHVGRILFPQYTILNMIGRIAFPLFAYQIGIGVSHTRDVKKYFWRLFIFGLVIQIFYIFAAPFINEDPKMLNIFFTLALGLIAIVAYEKKLYIVVVLAIVLPSVMMLFGITFDYEMYGVLLILGMHIFRGNFRNLAIFTIALTAIACMVWQYPIQMYAVLALIFIWKPFSVKASIHWVAFYLFYPAHLIVLQLVSELPIF